MEEIVGSYHKYKKDEAGFYPLDDISASDLHVDALFDQMDQTCTTPGQSLLYYWLRTQCATQEQLDERTALSKYFLNHRDVATKTRRELSKISHQRTGNASAMLLLNMGNHFIKYKNLYYLLIFFEFICVLLTVFTHIGIIFTIFAILLIALLNAVLYFKTTTYINTFSSSVYYISRIQRHAKKITSQLSENNDIPLFKTLAEYVQKCNKLPKGLSSIQMIVTIPGDILGILFDYMRIFFLVELSSYFRYYTFFQKNLEEITQLFELVGMVDASLNIAELLYTNEKICQSEPIVEAICSIENMTHPLIENCTPISITTKQSVIITGTNMSGKTTFLRTLGVNQILATTLGIAHAEKFQSRFFSVISAMNIQDNLQQGKSRYLAESERILVMMDACTKGNKLALIDEILTGTNNTDRIFAATQILQYLSKTDSFTVATTHDIEIAEAVSTDYTTYYFKEMIDENDLKFDYKMHHGIIDKKNALRLLHFLGFAKYIQI